MNTLKWLSRIINDSIEQSRKSIMNELISFDNSHKIMSFNIERDKSSKSDWPERREKISNLIKTQIPTIICMQEVMPHQYKYLANELEFNYTNYFTDAFTGKSSGVVVSEGLCIFFATEKYTLVDKGFIRLSNTIGFKTKHWRICQWVKLKTKDTDEEFYVFNTHLDHEDRDARKLGFDKILKKIEQNNSDSKTFVCGDFNSEWYWNETKDFSSKFDYSVVKEGSIISRPICIDYIFTRNVTGEHNCIREVMSDHYPITFTF